MEYGIMKLFLRLLDENDSLSMMRFLCLVSMVLGGGIGIYGIYRGSDLTGVAALCGVFVTAAVGGKFMQKRLEIQNEINNPQQITINEDPH